MPGPPLVFLQELCLKHKNLLSKNDLERPERLRAVEYGVGAVLGRLEESLAPTHTARTPDGIFKVVRSTATVRDLTELQAGKAVLGAKDDDEVNTPTYAERLKEWCRDSKKKIKSGEREVPSQYEGDLYRKFFLSVFFVVVLVVTFIIIIIIIFVLFGTKRVSDTLCLVCPQSYEAFCGAIATVCEAVDAVADASHPLSSPSSNSPTDRASPSNPTPQTSRPHSTRAFVAVRPPGHHCLPVRPF